jgi:hypothetical protein
MNAITAPVSMIVLLLGRTQVKRRTFRREKRQPVEQASIICALASLGYGLANRMNAADPTEEE